MQQVSMIFHFVQSNLIGYVEVRNINGSVSRSRDFGVFVREVITETSDLELRTIDREMLEMSKQIVRTFSNFVMPGDHAGIRIDLHGTPANQTASVLVFRDA